MIKITFPDGAVREFESGVTTFEIAQSISNSLAKKALAGKFNGKLIDTTRAITEDGSIEIVTPDHEDALPILRHSAAHLFAQAARRLFPDIHLGVGPAIEDGFYYDTDNTAGQISNEDLPRIEEEMKKIVKENFPSIREEVTKDEAREIFKNLGIEDDVNKMEINEGKNVTEVLASVSEGSNEVGIVYATDAASVADKVDIITEAPEGSLKTPVLYPVGLTEDKEASDSEAAAADAFLAYLQTDEALKVFEEYGFTPYKAEEKTEDAEENAETTEVAATEEAAE